MKIRYWLVLMLLLLIMIPVAQASDFYHSSAERVLTVPVGQDGVTVFNVPDAEVRGPQSFFVTNNNEIYICDTLTSRIIHFKNSKKLKEVAIDHDREFIDIYVTRSGQFYLLDEAYNVIVADYNGNIINKYDIPRILENSITLDSHGFVRTYYYDPEFIRVENGRIILTFENKKQYILGFMGLINYYPYEMKSKLNDSKPILEHLKTKNKIYVNSFGEVLEIFVKKQDTHNKHYLKVADYYQDGFERILEETIHVIDNDKITDIIPLLDNNFFKPNSQTVITDNGDVYQMIIDESKLNIYKLKKVKEKDYQSKINIFKDNLNHEKTEPTESSSNISILATSYPYLNRTSVYSNAVSWVYYDWTFNSTKNKDLSVTNPSSWVTQPDWLGSYNDGNDHTLEGIPYCWGGWNSSTFAPLISDGYYAGNIHAKYWDASKGEYVYHGHVSGTVGMDCSGFVSVAFGFSSKHSTRTLVQVDYNPNPPFSLIAKSSVAWMDILDKPGTHVMIVDSVIKDSSGNVVSYQCIESTTNGDDKVHYEIRLASKVTDYNAYRYKYWN